MKSRFKPDSDIVARISEKLIDPESIGMESCEASERQFAASLEISDNDPRFVVEEEHQERNYLSRSPLDEKNSRTVRECNEPVVDGVRRSDSSGQTSGYLLESGDLRPDMSSWKQQVAQRLSNYQSRRRPRAPRYPSLQLKFEPENMDRRGSSPQVEPRSVSDTGASAVPGRGAAGPGIAPQLLSSDAPVVEATARIIEFPRSSLAPPCRSEELAEPVFEKPRIMEAPEIPLPPPSLGGILIEPAEAPVNDKRPGFELPLQPARMGRRVAAMVVDAWIVFAALALFGYIFWRIVVVIPPFRVAALTAGAIAAILWTAYQYLLTVYCGCTPGLKLAKLQLSRFDGSLVPRKVRRWRVLACTLSSLSLGLGYAWCFLDEDQLCWHDRITHTYMK